MQFHEVASFLEKLKTLINMNEKILHVDTVLMLVTEHGQIAYDLRITEVTIWIPLGHCLAFFNEDDRFLTPFLVDVSKIAYVDVKPISKALMNKVPPANPVT